eukprot:3301607-Amphidinium_carterae.2
MLSVIALHHDVQDMDTEVGEEVDLEAMIPTILSAVLEEEIAITTTAALLDHFRVDLVAVTVEVEAEMILEVENFGGGDNPGERDRAWRGYVQEYRLNRDRMKLPKLDIAENYHTMPAATMQQKILNWVRDATKKIGTWHLDASWFEGTVKEAKRMHFKFVSSPREQCAIEKKYVLGRSAPVPRPEHALESVAREILDVLPDWL